MLSNLTEKQAQLNKVIIGAYGFAMESSYIFDDAQARRPLQWMAPESLSRFPIGFVAEGEQPGVRREGSVASRFARAPRNPSTFSSGSKIPRQVTMVGRIHFAAKHGIEVTLITQLITYGQEDRKSVV